MALNSVTPQSVSVPPHEAGQCPCGHTANSVTITDEDKELIVSLRELKPVMKFLRDFATATGSLVATSRKMVDTLKKQLRVNPTVRSHSPVIDRIRFRSMAGVLLFTMRPQPVPRFLMLEVFLFIAFAMLAGFGLLWILTNKDQ